mmetsp:Transcript_74141/g.162282  ORF Transcript_74141/g.162282 Transcript_74141/m.162282 type:complete len:219 (-) Transcript_74141:47-703(-)
MSVVVSKACSHSYASWECPQLCLWQAARSIWTLLFALQPAQNLQSFEQLCSWCYRHTSWSFDRKWSPVPCLALVVKKPRFWLADLGLLLHSSGLLAPTRTNPDCMGSGFFVNTIPDPRDPMCAIYRSDSSSPKGRCDCLDRGSGDEAPSCFKPSLFFVGATSEIEPCIWVQVQTARSQTSVGISPPIGLGLCAKDAQVPSFSRTLRPFSSVPRSSYES